jgi:CHAT domain-containing protein
MDASMLLSGHSDSVYDVAWAPDGNRLASAGRDGTLRVWGGGGGREAEFEFDNAVRTATFSHDGRLLGVGTQAGLVEVRETSSWKVVFTRKCESVESLLFLRQPSMLLAGGTDGLVHGWPLDGGTEVQYRTGQPVFSVRGSPDEEWLAIACRGRILFLRRLDRDPLAAFEAGESVDAYDCAIAPDGETCAAALRLRAGGSIGRTEDPDLFEIGIWRPRFGEQPLAEENLVGHVSWVKCVEFSPDSRLLASASFDCSVRLWDYVQLKQVAELRGHGAAVYAARFSPQSNRLATCSADSTIRIWPLERLSDSLHEQPLILREPSTPRRDGIGIDPVLMNAQLLADELIAIESVKRLHDTVVNTVEAADRELGLALQQIGNVRAEQARREGDLERVRRWRMVQSEVQLRGFEFVFAEILLKRGARDEASPAVVGQLSKLGKRDLGRTRGTADDYARTVLAIAQGELSVDEGRRRLAATPLDQRAVFVAAGMLQNRVNDVIAGRSSAAGLTQGIEVLALLLPTSTDPVIAATVFEIAGMLHCLTGDNRGGVSWLERAAAAARQGGWPQQSSSTLGNLGNALRNAGQLNAARAAYEQCLDIAMREGLREEFITHSSNLAMIAQDLGDHQSAFHHLRRAASVCRFILTALLPAAGEGSYLPELTNVAGRYSACLINLAHVYHEFGDDEGEAESYATAYEITKMLNDRHGMAACLGDLADVDRRMGRNQSAEERYQASYAIAQQIANFDGQVHTLAGQAVMRESAGQLAEAQALRAQAICIAREHGLRERLIVELCNLALVAEERGSQAEAEAALREAQVVANEVRQELRAPEEGPGIQEHVARIADALIRLYLRSGRPTDAFETAERARAGVLLGQLAGAQQGNRKPYSVDEILSAARRVGRRVVLVSYYVLPERVCTFVLRADEDRPHATEVPVSRRELVEIRRDFERQVARRFARTQAEETWLRLARFTIDPVLPYLRDGDLLIVAPHRLLQGLPLHALMAHGDRLVDRWPVAYVPSASAVVMMAARRPSTVGTCSVLGAHFTDEAKTVAEVLGVEAVAGAQLDKDDVLRALAESDVVHLSTHGFYVPDNPRRSGLVLRPTRETDAYLRVLSRPVSTTWTGLRLDLEDARARMQANVLETGDLVSTHSQARLVTMSACETGLVRTDAADDPVGLVPALLAMGVHGVVATLWLVDADVTAELMHEFYAALTQPGGWNHIPYALRDAVNAVRMRHPHPYNWAPVLLAGGIGEGTGE